MTMYRKPLTIAFFTVGLLSVGCLGAEEELDDLGGASPRMHALGAGVGGLIGTNHYLPYEFQANVKAIRDAAAMRLGDVLPNDHEVRSSVVGLGLFNTVAGTHTFEQAVSCGLSIGDYVTHMAGRELSLYNGDGYMMTTKEWRVNPLTLSQREDLFTCMITRLNPSGASVQFLLGGPNVNSSSGAISDFTYNEAVWATTETVNPLTGLPMLTFKVWPSPELLDACGGSISVLEQQITGRTCPTPSADCGLDIVTDTSTYPKGCTGSDMNWTCGGKPAIQTKLRKVDVKYVYPKCAI
jgi:hypothetical protein